MIRCGPDGSIYGMMPRQELPIMLGQAFATEVLKDAGLDRRIVTLEVEESLYKINVDIVEPFVADDHVRDVVDKLVDARLVEPSFAELVQRLRGTLRLDSARVFDSRMSPVVWDWESS